MWPDVRASGRASLMPTVHKPMVPPYLRAPEALVYASGAAQIAGGAGLMTHSTRRAAGWWLIATLIAMFPSSNSVALELGLQREPHQRVSRQPQRTVVAAVTSRPAFADFGAGCQ
jgi:uncharacterized membrane protein